MGEQVGGVCEVRALIWGFSSSSGKSGDIPRMRQRSVEIRRSKCKSYVVLRGAILEQ